MPQPQTQESFTWRQVVGLFEKLISMWAASVTPFLRTNFGRTYFISESVGIVLMILWSVCTTPPHLLAYWNILIIATAAMQSVHSLNALSSRSSPNAPHSRYNGSPAICEFFNVEESAAKSTYEPLLCLGLGGVIAFTLHGSIGVYFMIGGICIAADQALYRHQRLGRAEAVRDAFFEIDELDDDINSFGI